MRAAFVDALTEAAASDERVLLLTGDLGYTVLEPFIARFPQRYLNVGVAEQDLVGIATGLSEAGYIPFLYSIATFMTLRPYEAIRNGPAHHRLPVRIVGVGGGFEYGTAGQSHWALEDIGVMRMQPGLTVVVPADHRQAATAVRATWRMPGPIYYRIGKDDRTVVPGLDGRFRLGSAEVLAEGQDILLVGMGSIVSEMAAAADLLADRGVTSTVLVVSSFDPSPVEDLALHLRRHDRALVVEEHYEVGGLGSCVAEVVADNGIPCQVMRCGVSGAPGGRTGSTAFLRARHGLDRHALAAAAWRLLGRS
jgi:transketolase